MSSFSSDYTNYFNLIRPNLGPYTISGLMSCQHVGQAQLLISRVLCHVRWLRIPHMLCDGNCVSLECWRYFVPICLSTQTCGATDNSAVIWRHLSDRSCAGSFCISQSRLTWSLRIINNVRCQPKSARHMASPILYKYPSDCRHKDHIANHKHTQVSLISGFLYSIQCRPSQLSRFLVPLVFKTVSMN